ncbi:hypothetical protein IMCC26134_03015 [Verrucomicrobia bacterium IMCC26134]|nr:hypothetical protein IMCC26134_03015 [Verrucomicrobia bacterium IMCC26134]
MLAAFASIVIGDKFSNRILGKPLPSARKRPGGQTIHPQTSTEALNPGNATSADKLNKRPDSQKLSGVKHQPLNDLRTLILIRRSFILKIIGVA